MQSAVSHYALQPRLYLLEDLFILHPGMNDFLASAEAANCKVRPANTGHGKLQCPSVHPFVKYLLLP
jgi:hypothetical protein